MNNVAIVRSLVLSFLMGLVFLLAGCGGSDAPLSPSGIVVSPSQTGALVNGELQLTAFPQGGGFVPIEWEVIGGAVNGTVSSSGLYRAPATPGTYQVRVKVKDEPAKSAIATINVATALTVSIAPAVDRSRLGFAETLQFNATVTGTAPDAITWRVNSFGGGSITPAGLYSAPATPGVYEVVATSNQDPTKRGTFRVVVSDTKVVRMQIRDKGTVWIRMAQTQAPRTTDNFMSLARSGFYDGVVFHRYGPSENQPAFIQGGDPNTKTKPLDDPSIGTGGPGYQIDFEANPLLHETGSIAMARSQDVNSAGSQFYICHENIPAFDGNYVVFGKVIGGLDIAVGLRRGDVIQSATVLE